MWETFVLLLQALLQLLGWLGQLALPWLPALLWCAWWLWGVDWKKAWPILASGGWVGVVLLTSLVALAWSQISPGPCHCLGFPLPTFWWQLGASFGLVLLALFCGWLQGQLGWAPVEVSFDPPAQADEHGHH